jgi:quercetin dioxygenase-like cupin family protein
VSPTHTTASEAAAGADTPSAGAPTEHPPASFEAFEAESRALGYDEVLMREWNPNQVLATHAHPFDVKAWVVRGEVALTCAGTTRTVRAGESFRLPRDVPHAERYGPEGATFWAARRHAEGPAADA